MQSLMWLIAPDVKQNGLGFIETALASGQRTGLSRKISAQHDPRIL